MAKNLESSYLLDFYGSLLGEKQRRLFSRYYDDDLSLAEIADLEGMTRQGVRDAVKRAETQLLEMETKLGLAKRFQTVQRGLTEVRQCAEELAVLCKEASVGPQAEETIGRLLAIVGQMEENETES